MNITEVKVDECYKLIHPVSKKEVEGLVIHKNITKDIKGFVSNESAIVIKIRHPTFDEIAIFTSPDKIFPLKDKLLWNGVYGKNCEDYACGEVTPIKRNEITRSNRDFVEYSNKRKKGDIFRSIANLTIAPRSDLLELKELMEKIKRDDNGMDSEMITQEKNEIKKYQTKFDWKNVIDPLFKVDRNSMVPGEIYLLKTKFGFIDAIFISMKKEDNGKSFIFHDVSDFEIFVGGGVLCMNVCEKENLKIRVDIVTTIDNGNPYIAPGRKTGKKNSNKISEKIENKIYEDYKNGFTIPDIVCTYNVSRSYTVALIEKFEAMKADKKNSNFNSTRIPPAERITNNEDDFDDEYEKILGHINDDSEDEDGKEPTIDLKLIEKILTENNAVFSDGKKEYKITRIDVGVTRKNMKIVLS